MQDTEQRNTSKNKKKNNKNYPYKRLGKFRSVIFEHNKIDKKC